MNNKTTDRKELEVLSYQTRIRIPEDKKDIIVDSISALTLCPT